MKTFTTQYDLRDLESNINLSKLLALPFAIEDAEIDIEYEISSYIPATFYDPSEGGELEDVKITLTKINGFIVTKKQAKIIMDAIDDDEFRSYIEEWIWDDNKAQEESDDQDLEEYHYDMMHDR